MIIIVGSRRDGNSLKLAQYIKDKLDKERINTSIFIPGNAKIHICTGCMDCDKDGKCDFIDDMSNIINQIKSDDYIMFITPTRWNLLSGDLKIFIDRLNPLYSRQGLKNKKMIAVSIGSKDKSLFSAESSLNSLISFGESAKMNIILEKQFYNCLKENDILEQSGELELFIQQLKNIIQ